MMWSWRPIYWMAIFSMGISISSSGARADENRDQQRAAYAAAARQLAEKYSLARVAQNRVEVCWEDLLGMATPLSYRVPIQTCHHPDVVFVQPDLSIALGRDPSSLGLGFALGSPAQLPDMWKVTRKLCNGYLPIVESQWNVGSIIMTQTAFAVLPRDTDVVTGKESQYVVVRMTVNNKGTATQTVPFYVIVGRMKDCQNVFYGPFLAPVSRWQTPSLGITADAGTLVIDRRVLLTYRASAPTPASFHASLDHTLKGAGSPEALKNCLRFDIRLKPTETRSIDLVIAGSPKLCDEREQVEMERIDFDSALQRATLHWDRRLTSAMEYTTPEPRLNTLYKQLILSSLGNTLQAPDRPWHIPCQTPAQGAGVWAWEFAHMAVPMIAVGYHRELQPSLRYFTERQTGVGTHSAKEKAQGDVKSSRGAYVGSAGIFWMNETGSVLWAMASEYRYSRDVEWLRLNRSSILAAWDWVQAARSQTRITDAEGTNVPYYGLLPAGRPGDNEGSWHQFTFNDNFTWLGMSEIATAFREAGMPEAQRLTEEAEEYRQCILQAIRHEQFVDPETNLLFVPNSVGYRNGGPRDTWWHADGPVQLFDTGLLSPKDERFEPMVEYTRRKHGILMGLAEHVGGSEWYPNQTERSYYKAYLARGEIEKSLLVFYSNLVYGRSNDTYQTSERFRLDNPNFSAFQPNASGNGRMLDMMRRMLIDEQDAAEGTLWLFRGCPHRWFATGQTIAFKKAPTLFGELAAVTRSDGNTITVDLDAPAWQPSKKVILVLRHPEHKAIRVAMVNGKETATMGETVGLAAPAGRVRIVCKY